MGSGFFYGSSTRGLVKLERKIRRRQEHVDDE